MHLTPAVSDDNDHDWVIHNDHFLKKRSGPCSLLQMEILKIIWINIKKSYCHKDRIRLALPDVIRHGYEQWSILNRTYHPSFVESKFDTGQLLKLRQRAFNVLIGLNGDIGLNKYFLDNSYARIIASTNLQYQNTLTPFNFLFDRTQLSAKANSHLYQLYKQAKQSLNDGVSVIQSIYQASR